MTSSHACLLLIFMKIKAHTKRKKNSISLIDFHATHNTIRDYKREQQQQPKNVSGLN